ncbi:hypothetical protein [Microbulbifer sp. THAF38]|uniref:hypothetical protein n=1 Tax=Microbulbifer sp. THAF38 TaxID=2587856 RepID=UPI001268AC07|nr:hypothetical protein [Microbulbifer sp. THAF38]
MVKDMGNTKSGRLQEGEVMSITAGFPVLYRYIAADKSKPLMVFVPGNSHLARIFYGCPEAREEDFIGYWVHRSGHPFLAISFPIANMAFDGYYPNFTIADWGKQVAEVIDKIVSENSLQREVIVCGWSMGCKIAGALGKEAIGKSFSIVMFVAMSGDPAVPGFLPKANAENITMTPEGLANRESLYPWFFQALEDQSTYNGHSILPRDIYRERILGATPVALICTGLMYRHGHFEEDLLKTIQSANTFGYEDYPFPVVIHGNLICDAENILLNNSNWAFIRDRVLIRMLVGKEGLETLKPSQWESLQLFVRSSGNHFSVMVPGNHFFFVGAIGARATVEKILMLQKRILGLIDF